MNDRATLQVTSRSFAELTAYFQESGSGASIEDLASAAISEWVAQARAHVRAGAVPKLRGYQWKSLFLP